MNFENAKHTLFTDKQHYLNFRKAWAAAVNSPNAKKKVVPCKMWDGFVCKYIDGGARTEKGWVKAEHMLLFCLLTEKNISKAFTHINKKSKLLSGHAPFKGLDDARHFLWFICSITQVQVDMSRINKETIENFLAPFADTVTLKMLNQLFPMLDEYKKKDLAPVKYKFGPNVEMVSVSLVKNKKLIEEILKKETPDSLIWDIYDNFYAHVAI